MKVTLFILYFFILRLALSQNLILNPSFEIYDNKKQEIVNWEMTAWTPDYYSLNLPKTTFNKKEYLTPFGDAYIGLLECEVISTKLAAPLLKDKEYLVRIFAAKPPSFCPSGVKRLTAAFTKGKLPKKEGPVESYYSVKYITLYSENYSVVTENNKWVEFFGIYKSKGGETYFNLGAFGKLLASDGKSLNEAAVVVDSLNIGYCKNVYYDNISVVQNIFQSGNVIIIDSLFFEKNKSQILPISFYSLDKLCEQIIKLNKKKLKVIGHTDNDGDALKNKLLSEQRAKNVENYLIKKGVSKNIINSIGMGGTKPITSNTNEIEKAKNRRVEIIILE